MSTYELIKSIPYSLSRPSLCTFDLYIPEQNPTGSLIIYFVGGGLKKCNKNAQPLPPALADLGYAVAVPEYRIFPEAKYPQFITDAAEAVCAVLTEIKNRTDAIKNVYIGGHSAGAYLSMMLAFDERYLGRHGIPTDLAAGYLFLSGQPTKHFSVLESEGRDKTDIVVDDTAPLYHLPESGRSVPPMLVVSSNRDMAARLEQNLLLCASLRARGHKDAVTFVNLGDYGHGEMVREVPGKGIPVLRVIDEFITATAK